jgi:squalene-associated FAD-dependent desaturase
LRVQVFDAEGRRAVLSAAGLPAPLHMGLSFVRYQHLPLSERLRIGRTMLAAYRMRQSEAESLNVRSFAEWLRARGETDRAIREFWDFMLIPTLNCRSEDASAEAALFVLREGLLKSSTSAAIGVPAAGLSALHVDPAVRYIEARGGKVRTGSGVNAIATDANEAVALVLESGEHESCEAVVLAVDHGAVAALVGEQWAAQEPFRSIAAMRSSPIVNLHFWFDRPVAPFSFAAFVGSELQWVFNRTWLDREQRGPDEHLVVSLSAADDYMPLTKLQLRERFLPQLQRALPAAGEAELLDFVVIKEPAATFIPSPGLRRPGPATPIANLVLAGAYTATGWPATMESAVRGGLAAARELHGRLASPTQRRQFAGTLGR